MHKETDVIEEIVDTSQPKNYNLSSLNQENSINRINHMMEKLNFYIDNKEFETIILYMNETFPQFLKEKTEILYTILLSQLIDMILKDEDFHTIEKYFQLRILEVINSIVNSFLIKNNFKERFENVRTIIDSSFYLKKRDFKFKFDQYLKHFTLSLRLELLNYYNKTTCNMPFSCTMDSEICREISLHQNDQLHHHFLADEEVQNQGDYYKKFLNFIDEDNKQQNILKFIVPTFSSFKDKEEQPKKERKSGNKIDFVIEDFLEAKANASTVTTSTLLTKKNVKEQVKENKLNIFSENTFLKEFTQKFIKREVIDKKIIRAFRKYLKKESSTILKKLEYKKFWIIFIKDNLLPPMKLFNSDLNINVEFKSFSVKYIMWLFSQPEAKYLYKEYVSKNGEKLYKNLVESIKFDNNSDKDYSKFTKNLYYYINNMTKIYTSIEIESHNLSAPHSPICPVPPSQNILIEGIYGPDFKSNEEKFLNFNRTRSNHRIDDELTNEEELFLLNDLYHQNSYGDLNLSKTSIPDNMNDNLFNEE